MTTVAAKKSLRIRPKRDLQTAARIYPVLRRVANPALILDARPGGRNGGRSPEVVVISAVQLKEGKTRMTQAMPPAGAFPPGQPVQYTNQPQTNPMAIVSLICGIVGCLFITPIIGIITGVIALGKAKVAGGKGMAIAGIILSILWIVGGIGFGALSWWGVNKAIAYVESLTKEPAITFINHLGDGDIAAASKMTDIPEDQLRPIAEYVKDLGKCTDISINSPQIQSNNGITTAQIRGTATFEKGTKQIYIDVTQGADGKIMIQEIELK
jgi:hypothetical protein